MFDEDGTVRLTYSDDDRYIQFHFNMHEDCLTWVDFLEKYRDFLLAVGFLFDPDDFDRGVEVMWEAHRERLEKAEGHNIV